jgi:large subunit ribosomal protein L21
MYAVVETGGKQYKVSKDDTILVELFETKEGKTVSLDKVLLAKEGNSIHVGTPYLKGASVTCEVLGQKRTDKVVAFKYKRRKSEKKKIGHRSDMIELKVKAIEIGK